MNCESVIHFERSIDSFSNANFESFWLKFDYSEPNVMMKMKCYQKYQIIKYVSLKNESIHWITILLGKFHMNRESVIRENRWIATSLPYAQLSKVVN